MRFIEVLLLLMIDKFFFRESRSKFWWWWSQISQLPNKNRWPPTLFQHSSCPRICHTGTSQESNVRGSTAIRCSQRKVKLKMHVAARLRRTTEVERKRYEWRNRAGNWRLSYPAKLLGRFASKRRGLMYMHDTPPGQRRMARITINTVDGRLTASPPVPSVPTLTLPTLIPAFHSILIVSHSAWSSWWVGGSVMFLGFRRAVGFICLRWIRSACEFRSGFRKQ